MSIVLEAFPKVSRELVVKSGYIATKYSFSFHDNGEIRQLSATPTDSSTSRTAVLKLEDQDANGIRKTMILLLNAEV